VSKQGVRVDAFSTFKENMGLDPARGAVMTLPASNQEWLRQITVLRTILILEM